MRGIKRRGNRLRIVTNTHIKRRFFGLESKDLQGLRQLFDLCEYDLGRVDCTSNNGYFIWGRHILKITEN